MILRPGLRWGLASAVLASGVALWWPDSTVSTAVVAMRVDDGARGVEPRGEVRGAVARGSPALLPRLPAAALEPARFDPFVGVAPPAPPAPPPVAAPVAPVVVPQAPAPSYRFLGRMNGPDGSATVYLVRGDDAVAVVAGTHLDDGWVVEAITPQEVRLHYPSPDANANVPIPSSAATPP